MLHFPIPVYRRKVEAEAVPELSARYKIEVVPSFVYLRVGGTVVDKVNAHA